MFYMNINVEMLNSLCDVENLGALIKKKWFDNCDMQNVVTYVISHCGTSSNEKWCYGKFPKHGRGIFSD